MKIRRIFYNALLCLVILISMSGCSAPKKSNSLDERLQGTIYSELNHKVDSQGKEVYQNDRYAVQVTDSKQGRGFYSCILAAWPKDGKNRKIANDNNALIGDVNDAQAIQFGPSLPLSTMHKSYYEDGITYICCSINYTNLRNDLRFQIVDGKLESQEKNILADIYIAPKTVVYEKKQEVGAGDGWEAFQQPDGSVLVCDGAKNFHISKLGIWYEDGKNILEKEMMLTYKNGKEQNVKRFMVDEPYHGRASRKYITLWESKCILQVENLKSMEIGESHYQFQ